MNKELENELRAYLGVKPFNRKKIKDYFTIHGEILSDKHLAVKISRLKAKGLITNVGRGIYRLNNKKIFEPEITEAHKKLASRVKKEFPFLFYSLWSTKWLNDLTTLQLLRNINIVQ